MARGDSEGRAASGGVNPFHAAWFTAAAGDLLYEADAVRVLVGAGAALPVTREAALGRLPVPHDAGLRHDHCFLGEPTLATGREAEGLGALVRAARGPLLVLRAVPADGPAHAALRARPGARVLQRWERAMLRSELPGTGYLEESMRGKKRKEMRRLRARLEDRGAVTEEVLDGRGAGGGPGGTDALTTEFLALEALGWKGQRGSAMAARPAEALFLRAVLAGAAAAGALRVVRLSLDGAAIAMILCFLASDGGLYTYKIAHDPDHARSSPGVMAEMALTRWVLDTGGVAYADSCAAEGHPMIDHVWRERRAMADWAVPTGPAGRAVLAAMGLGGRAARP